MDYIEIYIQQVSGEKRDILISLLAESGFESFIDENHDLRAYVPLKDYLRHKVTQICLMQDITFTEQLIPDQNWNAEWEKNFEPVLIAGKCYVRAPFHLSRPEFPYELIIEPKMSFGTAHHDTTALMIEEMLEMDIRGKRVLDMGCGTGILAILAEKMGASEIHAVDTDEWAFNNTQENCGRNNTSRVVVTMGDISAVDASCDIILANINRNVLLQQIPEYSKHIRNGDLLMSGFYENDLEKITEMSVLHSFRFDHYRKKNEWVVTRFMK